MTTSELAKIVADDFKKTMKEFDFDTFEDMCECYWWNSTDIKDEVDFILRCATDHLAYIDEIDRTMVITPSEMISYRSFSRMFRKLLK